MSFRKTSIEIDVTLLSEVQQVLGTSTIRDTVEEAFLEVLRSKARREEVEALASMEKMDLADAGIMAGAWRPSPQS
jgi:Arc/MetJ family transcription regulator